MIYAQVNLDMVDRHFAEGEQHVVNQERIIVHLRNVGGAVDVAKRS